MHLANGGASARTPAAGGTVKGTLLIARMKYLRAQGHESVERVLGSLSKEDQQVLRGMLLPSTWYSADLLTRFEATIATVLAKGDRRALFLDMGHFTADTNLGPRGVQRPYLKVDDPHFLLRNVPRMYATQHSGGTRTYEQTGARSATVRTLAEGGPVSPDDCLTSVGWLRRAIELSGGKSVTVEETHCRAQGAPCCEYVCNWA